MQMITAFSPQELVANQTMFQGIYGYGNGQDRQHSCSFYSNEGDNEQITSYY